MTVTAKICGLTSPETVEAAIKAGAAYIGFVFFPPSPRYLDPAKGRTLAQIVPPGIEKVGVFVDPADIEIELVLDQMPLDIIQLHGDETPERVAHLQERFGLKVMKAVAISGEADIELAKTYETVADLLLFDAKPPKSMAHALPGGNGLIFDWTLVGARLWKCPWMLSGGLSSEMVGEAVLISGAGIVDVSSGVETAPGQKSQALIEAFMATVNRL